MILRVSVGIYEGTYMKWSKTIIFSQYSSALRCKVLAISSRTLAIGSLHLFLSHYHFQFYVIGTQPGLHEEMTSTWEVFSHLERLLEAALELGESRADSIDDEVVRHGSTYRNPTVTSVRCDRHCWRVVIKGNLFTSIFSVEFQLSIVNG